jgi:hypothetical protein
MNVNDLSPLKFGGWQGEQFSNLLPAMFVHQQMYESIEETLRNPPSKCHQLSFMMSEDE